MKSMEEKNISKGEKKEKSPDAESYSSEDSTSWTGRFPVIGVFWDIENCRVPKGKSAAAVAQAIRNKLFNGHREVEFVVVCDVTKEHPRIVEELNCAKVNLIHVSATCKNAADDKLRQTIRHFGETYGPGSTLVLITGDINFSSELIELRHHRMMRVILLHNTCTSDTLKLCANESYHFGQMVEDVPERDEFRDRRSVQLLVTNIPDDESPSLVKARLRHLCNNAGGRVWFVGRDIYSIRFPNMQLALRAQRRMDGQDVFGRRITVSDPQHMELSRTEEENRPRQSNGIGKRWDSLAAANMLTPLNNKLEKNHLTAYHPSYHSDLHKHNMVNNILDTRCATDSSSGGYDDDSDGGGSCSWPCEEENVDVKITGLDPELELFTLRRALSEVLGKFTKVINLALFSQSDGSIVAIAKVPCLRDAQTILDNLQNHQIGERRIHLSFQNTSPEQLQLIRKQVAQLLSEVGSTKIPLFQFKELLKSRFQTMVSVSELRKINDVCVILEEERGRLIAANPWAKNDIMEVKNNIYCGQHGRMSGGYFGEPPPLPYVVISLSVLTDQCHMVLKAHQGRVPLASLYHCFCALSGPFQISEKLGVSLEHLVSCVPDVEIIHSEESNKLLVWAQSHSKPVVERSTAVTSLALQLVQILKTFPRALISMSNLMSAYHQHFGKQLHPSDYGHSELSELLESMSDVVQVIGFGSRRDVTLCHNAQMKRFKSDLIKLLTRQQRTTVNIEAITSLYTAYFHRPCQPFHYGLCSLEDLINCVESTELRVTSTGNGSLLVGITIHEHTAEREKQIRQLKAEVVELLTFSSECTMTWSKFRTLFHSFYGKPCRLPGNGFPRLNDLFSTIADVVSLVEAPGGEKIMTLTSIERLKIAGERIHAVLISKGGALPLAQLKTSLESSQMRFLAPVHSDTKTLEQLLKLLSDYVKMVESRNGYIVHAVCLVDDTLLSLRARYLMLRSASNSMSKVLFRKLYTSHYLGQDINVDLVASRIPHIVQVSGDNLSLTLAASFSNQVYVILHEFGDKHPLFNFEMSFLKRFGVSLQPREYGHPTVFALLDSFPEMFQITAAINSRPRYLTLNRAIKDAGFTLPVGTYAEYSLWDDSELTGLTPPDACTLPLPEPRLIPKKLTSEIY